MLSDKIIRHSNLYIFSENYLLRPLALYLSENNCLKLSDCKFEVLLRSYEILLIGISRQGNCEFTSMVFDCITAYRKSSIKPPLSDKPPFSEEER